MSRKEFKKRWLSDDEGGGITVEEIAECAVAWGICGKPKIHPFEEIAEKVLAAAGCPPIK